MTNAYDLIIIGAGPTSDVIPAKAGAQASLNRGGVDIENGSCGA